MSYTTESQAAGRHILPDLIRAFAILGIVLVNVAYLAYPGEVTYHDGGLNTAADQAAYFGVNALFLFKAYSLFSLMFGAGLAYQMMSAERRGLPFGRRYARRLLGLIILGILHVSFAFIGDILIIYAIFGALLYLFRKRTVKSLIRWGIFFLILQVLLSALGALGLMMGEIHAPEEMAAGFAEMEANFPRYYDIYGSGSFIETIAQRWTDWTGFLIFSLPIQGPGILGFFILGLAAVKSGVISDPSASLWSKARRFALPLGLLISVAGAFFMFKAPSPISSQNMFGTALILLGSPFATLGYTGLLAKWAEGPHSALRSFIARGGTATLTAYLLQSIILSLVFNGYGLGQYGQIGAAGCIAIALVVGLFTLIFVSLWRKKFRYGPFEVLLRRFTYWGDNR